MSAANASLLFSAVVAVATVVYAILTWQLVTETRRLRRAQTEAHVSASLYLKEGLIHFVHLLLRNDGVGPASNVAFTVRSLSEGANQEVLRTIQELGAIKDGIRYMAPGQEFRVWLTSVLEDFESKMQTAIELSISLTTGAGERRIESYVLDFGMFRGFRELGKPPLPEIAENVKKIADEVTNIRSGRYHIRVRVDEKDT